MTWPGVVIFAVTYVLISARRLSWLGLDRPAGALVGAVACVALGVLSPTDALAAINGPTLLLLFGVMGMGTFLAFDGYFAGIEKALAHWAKTPTRLLACIVWGSGLLSAFITNDAVCVLGAPLVVRLIRRYDLPRLPFLLALATGANTGSVATLVGNPQNMLCAMLGQLSYRDHLLVAAPLSLLCLGINHALLALTFRRQLTQRWLEVTAPIPPLDRRSIMTLAIIGGTAILYTAGANLAWSATLGFVVLMLLHRSDTALLWAQIDWSLLLFFSGLFVVVEALLQSGAPARFFETFPLASLGAGGTTGWFEIALVYLFGSNVVSNVPFILVVRDQVATLPHPALGWELLAVVSTFAGNLTLLGSVANIIVAESARDLGGIGFFDYLKVGVPLALSTTLLAVFWLVAFVPR